MLDAPSKQPVQEGTEIVVGQPQVGATPQTKRPLEDMPFVADRPAREGLKAGQWDPAQNAHVQADIVRRGLLKNMYYCLGLVPKGGLKVGDVHEATAMGTRLVYWLGTCP